MGPNPLLSHGFFEGSGRERVTIFCEFFSHVSLLPFCNPIRRHSIGQAGIAESDSLDKSTLEVIARYLPARSEAKYHTSAAMPCACVIPPFTAAPIPTGDVLHVRSHRA